LNTAFERPSAPEYGRYAGYCGERTLRIYRAGSERPVALVLLMHGGGFVSGGPDAVATLAQQLAARLASAVVTPSYTLAREAPFPAAAEDAYAALQWAAGHAAASGWGETRLVLAGVEAGGNLAAGTAMMARDRGGPPVAAQVLIRPMLDPSQSTRSMRCSGAEDAQRCRAAYRAYLPSGADQVHPYAAPLASLRLAGLPPALIVTGDGDPLRDEAESYAANLIRAGVTTQVTRLARADAIAAWDAATLDAVAHFLGPRIAAASRTQQDRRTLP
jgi:acetyl esterase/lipase